MSGPHRCVLHPRPLFSECDAQTSSLPSTAATDATVVKGAAARKPPSQPVTEHFPALLAQSCSHVSGGRCGSPFHPSPQRAQWTLCSPLFPEQLSQESAELLWEAGEKAAGPPAGPRWRGQAEVGWVSPAAADKGLPSPAPGEGPRACSSSAPAALAPRSVTKGSGPDFWLLHKAGQLVGGSWAQLGTQHVSGPACRAPWRVQCSEFSGW